MKKNILKITVLVLTFLVVLSNMAYSQPVDKATLWSENSTMTFLMVHYYKAEKNVVMTLGKLLDNDNDVSVCLYLSKKTQLHPQDIMGLKRAGQSWKQIVKSIGFQPATVFTDMGLYEIFGVPKVFKHSYGEYKKWQNDPSHEMDLTDDDFRDMVQLRFVVKNFGVPYITVMRKRNAGYPWTNIIINKGQ